MHRYFFDILDGWKSKDHEGTEFPDFPAARTRAVKLAAEIIRDSASEFEHRKSWRFIVRNHDGKPVFTLDVTGDNTDPSQGA